MRPWTQAHVLRGVEGGGAPLPDCACCGEVARLSCTERRFPGGPELRVPYCNPCHGHAAAADTRRQAVAASAALLALSLVLLLPLILVTASMLKVGLLVAALTGIPAVLALAFHPRPRPGHSAGGRAVWWGMDGSLRCTSARFAQELASAHAVTPRVRRVLPGVGSTGLYAAVSGAVLASPLVHAMHFPEVRVLNHGYEPVVFAVDGVTVARVEPSAVERPHAGASLRVAAGLRRLELIGLDGTVVAALAARVRSGGVHLYAPLGAETCFWVESRGYGRAELTPKIQREPLSGTGRFWLLPPDLDLWFTPTPDSTPDHHSSGGVLRALRQGPCPEGPGLH